MTQQALVELEALRGHDRRTLELDSATDGIKLGALMFDLKLMVVVGYKIKPNFCYTKE